MTILIDTVEHSVSRQIAHTYDNKSENLIEILHAVQQECGYVSNAALRTIADALNISRADIYGVASFYHDIKREAPAKLTIKMCRAEACQAVGAHDLIADAQEVFGVKFNQGGADIALEAVYCLGNCALGPAIMIEDTLYGRVDLKRLQALAAQYGHK